MRTRTALVVGLLAVFAAAGCGSGDDDGDGVASAGGATDSASADDSGGGDHEDPFQQALDYSQCMRDNGVENFPDPEKNDDGGISLQLGKGLDPNSDEFKAAEDACKDLQPGAGDNGEPLDPEVLEAMQDYADCMRENGIENFPDPNPDGGFMINGDDLGVDPNSDEMKQAEEACKDLMPKGPGEQSNHSEEG